VSADVGIVFATVFSFAGWRRFFPASAITLRSPKRGPHPDRLQLSVFVGLRTVVGSRLTVDAGVLA